MITINAADAPEGIVINLFGIAAGDPSVIPRSTFPSGWTVLGRGYIGVPDKLIGSLHVFNSSDVEKARLADNGILWLTDTATSVLRQIRLTNGVLTVV